MLVSILLLFLAFQPLHAQEKTRIAVFPFENEGEAFYDWMSYGFAHILGEVFEATGIMTAVPPDSVYEATLNPNVDLKNVYNGVISPSFIVYQAGWDARYGLMGRFRVLNDTTIEIHYKIIILARRALTQPTEIKGRFGLYTDVYKTHLKLLEAIFADLIGWNIPIDRQGVEQAHQVLRKRVADYDELKLYIGKWLAIKHYDAAIRLTEAQDYDRAIRYFDLAARYDESQSLNIAQNLARTYVLRGTKAYEKNEKDAAEKDYRTAIAADSGNSEAYYNLGNICKDQEKWEEAELWYQKALSLKPDFTAAYINLAFVYGQKGDWNTALRTYQTARTYDAENAMIHYFMGIAYENTGDAASAKNAYEDALRLDSTLAGAHLNLGVLYKQMKDLVRARRHYERALTYDPLNALAHRNLGILLMNNKKEIAQAVYHLEKTLELNPAQENAAQIRKNIDILKKKLPKKKKK